MVYVGNHSVHTPINLTRSSKFSASTSARSRSAIRPHHGAELVVPNPFNGLIRRNPAGGTPAGATAAWRSFLRYPEFADTRTAGSPGAPAS
jgi:hypothetical protein